MISDPPATKRPTSTTNIRKSNNRCGCAACNSCQSKYCKVKCHGQSTFSQPSVSRACFLIRSCCPNPSPITWITLPKKLIYWYNSPQRRTLGGTQCFSSRLFQMLKVRWRSGSASGFVLPERFMRGPFVCHDTLVPPHMLRDVLAPGLITQSGGARPRRGTRGVGGEGWEGATRTAGAEVETHDLHRK